MEARSLKGAPRGVVLGVGAAMMAYACLYVSGALMALGINILVIQHRAIVLSFGLVLTFLLYPMRKSAAGRGLSWHDWASVAIAIVPTGYIALFPGTALDHWGMGRATGMETILGLVLMALILEAGRRVIGLAMPIVALFFVIHPLVSGSLPSVLFSRSLSLDRLMSQIYLSASGIMGTAIHIGGTIILIFVLFGALLVSTGAGKFFVNLALFAVGRFTGGVAKVPVISSFLFGTASGSVGANIAVDGPITIPMMKGAGYRPSFAAAVETVSSNGGIITPPVMGAVAFIIAEVTGIPYYKICIASALPAVLYYTGVYCQVDFESRKMGIKGMPLTKLPSPRKVLAGGWQFILPFFVLFFTMFYLHYSPEKSGWWTLVTLVVISLFRKEGRLTPGRALAAVDEGGRMSVTVLVACALAGVIMASVASTGFGIRLSGAMIDLSGGSVLLLLIMAAVASFILGMGMTSIPCYVMVAVMTAPALVKMGVPLLAAHLFVFWWGIISFLTPPVCTAAYIAAGIAGAPPMETGWQSSRLAIAAYFVPFFFCFFPEYLMNGAPASIVLVSMTAILGLVLISGGIEGYMLRVVSWWGRILLLASGATLMLGAWQADVIGALVGLVPIIRQWQLVRQSRQYPVVD